MKIKRYLIGLCGLLLAACGQQEIARPWESGSNSGDLQLQLSTKGLMNRYVVTSKGTDVKTSEEQEIKTLHVFLFDQEGAYLQAKEANRYQNYITGGRTVINIDRQGWKDNGKAEHATVIVVANVEDGTFLYEQTTQPPTNIPDRDSLLRFIYRPLEDRLVKDLPESGMPMFACINDVDLTSSNSEQSIDIPLQALMARVDVSLQLNSNYTDADGLLPSLTLTKCEVLNAPEGVRFVNEGDTTALSKIGKINYSWQPAVSTLYNRDGVAEASFYVFENMQLPSYEGYPEKDYSYPDSLSADGRQKYKPLLADTARALAFRFTGNYVTYNGGTYEATYTLYLGANHTDDFKVVRNKQYKNDITIKGLENNKWNSGEHVTFDARVNVTETNPYFISMLKDRTMDSHFNVVPMDVYFFNNTPTGEKRPKQTLNVEIVGADWIRLEKVDSAMMANGTAPDGCIATGGAWKAGNGKRKYFTVDLVTEALAENDKIEGVKNRDRVYLYVDENVGVRRLNSDDPRSRTATLRVTYCEDGQPVSSRDLTLEQANLLEVTFHSSGEDNGMNGKKIYIEAYEEYLDYADPLDEYSSDMVFNGLPWEVYEGSGTRIGSIGGVLDRVYCYENYYWGHEFTQRIVELAKDNITDLNTAPKTAAGYCYNKNKRNPDGSISESKWYLPGIRELERILEDYYIEYPEFQQNYYWSSAAGMTANYLNYWPWYSWQNTGENQNHARATKAYINNGKFDYYPSSVGDDGNPKERPMYEDAGRDNGNSGRANRKTALRIRAARIDAEPQ